MKMKTITKEIINKKKVRKEISKINNHTNKEKKCLIHIMSSTLMEENGGIMKEFMLQQIHQFQRILKVLLSNQTIYPIINNKLK